MTDFDLRYLRIIRLDRLDGRGARMPAETMPWWGSWTLKEGEVRHWRIGPLVLMIERRAREWRVAYETGTDPLEPGAGEEIDHSAESLDELTTRERFAWARDDGSLSVRPALADRGMVFRPETRLTVLPKDEVEMHVSSPVWVDVIGGAASIRLLELPCHRPSDTWLGSTTVEGELCYASRTHCRLRLEDLPWRSHRAVTSVRVRNHTDAPMPLERISLPLPNLELFGDSSGRLVTSSIRLTREGDGTDLAKLEIDDGPPSYASSAELLTRPRREIDETGFVHAFAGLF